MPLSVPGADPAATARARESLSALGVRIARPLQDTVSGAVSTAAVDPLLVDPIPVYAVDVTAPDPLASARLSGWRYIVAQSAQVGAVDVAVEPGREPSVIADAALAERLSKAATFAGEGPAQEADYELRLLDLQMIGGSLLWLKARGDGEDRFVSLSQPPRERTPADVEREIRRGAQAVRAARASTHSEAGA